MIGTNVIHARFGRGTIHNVCADGRTLSVLFEDGSQRLVPINEITFLRESRYENEFLPESSHSLKPFEARRIIEALRLGVAPQHYTEALTIGREKELERAEAWLDDPQVGTMIVEGSYGSGKTHILDCIYERALRKGYAAARVGLDPSEASPIKPKAVYRKLVQSFRYLDHGSRRDFRDFLFAAVERDRDALLNHRFLGVVANPLGAGLHPDRLAWIEGRESSIEPRLPDDTTAANVYCHILSGLAWAARSVMGLQGLAIFVDEAENASSGWYHRSPLANRSQLLLGLLLLAANDARLENEPFVTAAAPNRASGGFVGRDTELLYWWRRPVRFCFALPSFLKIALAFTPTSASSLLEVLSAQRVPFLRILLGPIPQHLRRKLVERIAEIYAQAYHTPLLPPDYHCAIDLLVSDGRSDTRWFVKTSVELLDRLRLGTPLPFSRH
jgi:hypothetical protein